MSSIHDYLWEISQDEKASENVTQRLISSETARKVQRETRDTLLAKWKRWKQDAISKFDKADTAVN